MRQGPAERPASGLAEERQAKERQAAGRQLKRRWPWVVGGIVVLLAVLVAVWDWNWFKGPIERQVTAATGREFHIEGDLKVGLGRVIRIRADNLWLANADWSDEREMARVGSLDVGVELLPLLRKQLVLPWVRIGKPSVLAERDAQGRNNWTFEPVGGKEPAKDSGGGGMALPRVGELTVIDGHARYREPDTDVSVDIASRTESPTAEAGSAPPSPPLDLKGRGRYRGQDFNLEAHVDSPVDLQQTDRPYRMAVDARAGKTQASASGAIPHPLQLADFSLKAAVSGPDMAELSRLAGTPLPKTPPYSLEGRLARRGKVISFEEFAGRMGDSDLGGNVSYEPRDPRPMLRADLQSKRLDIDDLGGLVGLPPATGKGETASPAQRAEAKREAGRKQVLPDKPFELGKLRSIDADVRLKATRIDAASLPISGIDTRVRLEAGKLGIDPLEANVAGGRVQGRVGLDASGDPIAASTRLRLRSLQLPRLAPAIDSLTNSAGTLSGSVELAGRGNSVADLLATSNGNLSLGVGKGRLSNLVLELAGLDIAESLAFLAGKDKLIALRCAWVQLDVEKGVAEIRSAALDTTDTVLFVQGKAGFADESLGVRMVPQPKDMSPLALRTPINVEGTFKTPKVRPDPKPWLARGAAAAVLYAIAPPAALLALIETGPGKDTDCGQAQAAKAKQP